VSSTRTAWRDPCESGKLIASLDGVFLAILPGLEENMEQPLSRRILRLLDQLMEVTDTEVFHLSLWTVVRDSHNYRFQALLYITHRLKGASSEQVVTASSKQTVVRPIVWEGDKRNVPVRLCLYIHPCLYEHMCVWGGGSACVYVHIYVYACVSHMCIDVAKAWKHGTVPLLLPGHFIFVVY
jgi:hypothetical protein